MSQDNIDLPKVGTNTDGKAPSMTIPKSDPPKKLVSNYVIEGKGDVVKDSDSVVVNYIASIWKDGKEFDSTYKQGKPANFPIGQLTFKGLKEGLAGKKVGSRVLIVPPAGLSPSATRSSRASRRTPRWSSPWTFSATM